MGRVTELAVNEGDRVKQGQFLLQIDPRNLRTRGRRAAKRRSARARSQAEQLKLALESAQDAAEAGAGELQAPAGALEGRPDDARAARARGERAQVAADRTCARRSRTSRRSSCASTRSRRRSRTRKTDLSKVRIESPIDGIVTRRNIEEGETAVVGTMNNAGTVLLTIADMSVIEAEVEVDETDIPTVKIGQPAKITIDAMPGKTFTGKVTEIGNSPIQAPAQRGRDAGDELQGRRHPRRRDAGRAARASRARPRSRRRRARTSLAVPIQATTVREMVVDDKGEIVREPPTTGRRRAAPTRRRAGRRAEAGPGAQGDRGRVRGPRRQGGVRAGQDRHRRREVLRGAVRPEGRRRGDHRSVQPRCARSPTAPS